MSLNKEELLLRCKELGIPTENLANNTQRKAAIDKKEAELAADTPVVSEEVASEEVVSEEVVSEEVVSDEVVSEEEGEKSDHYKDDRGRVWYFKKSAPKQLNIDGHPMSQKEILETEDVISELVYGNSSLLTQKND